MASRLSKISRPSEGADPPPPGEPAPKSVLVVEDDVDLLSVLEFGLTAQGLEPVWTATDGEGAITALFTHRPDFVLLDFQLPKVGGEAVATAAKRLLPRTKIVLYTGVLKERPEWADALLLKPNVEGVLDFFRENA